jgi:hypothetical protein
MTTATKATADTLIISAKTLKFAVSLAATAAAGKTHLPILRYLLLHAEAGWLTVTGTDLNGAIRVRVPCSAVDGDFDFAVEAGKLNDFCATLPDTQEATFSVAERAVLTCGRSRATFSMADAEEFPHFPADSEEFSVADAGIRDTGSSGITTWFTAMGERVARCLLAVTPFCGPATDSRAIVANVGMIVKDGKLSTMASDSYSVALNRGLDSGLPFGQTADVKTDADALLPPSGALTLAKTAAAQGQARVTLCLVGPTDNPNGLLLYAGGGFDPDSGPAIQVYARLAEGRPKDMWSVMRPPNDSGTGVDPVRVTTALFSQAVARVSPFGVDSVHGTPVNIKVQAGTMTITALGAETGEGVDELDCLATTGLGDPLPDDTVLTAKVGSRYLTDAIKCMTAARGGTPQEMYLDMPEPGKSLEVSAGTGDGVYVISHMVTTANSPDPTPPPAPEPDDEFAPEPEDLGDE